MRTIAGNGNDALDSIMRDSDRYSLVVDLSGKAMTFFQYADDPPTHLPTCVAISSTTTATITSATSIHRHMTTLPGTATSTSPTRTGLPTASPRRCARR